MSDKKAKKSFLNRWRRFVSNFKSRQSKEKGEGAGSSGSRTSCGSDVPLLGGVRNQENLRAKERMVAGEVTPVAYDPEQMELTPISVAGSASSSQASMIGNTSITSDNSSNEQPASPRSIEFYEGDLICLKVKDVLGITPVCGVHAFVYTPAATFKDLFSDVALRFQIVLGDFELVYQSKSDIYELTQMPPDEPLSAADLLPSREKEYSITINGKKRGRRGKANRGVARKLDEAFASCASETNGKEVQSSAIGDENAAAVTNRDEAGTVRRDFVGLKNMNMTCYLNSLLQSLWFTPEFRNLVYVYNHKPERYKKRSICSPLQKLFLRLQFAVRESIETDELTSTFGWNSRDTWYQHDIEELCNLMMENLSEEFKGTPLEGMIEALYFGSFNDYVKCLKCENSNMKDAAFLVIPLPIRQFGSALANPTLEEALKCFTMPEVLDGNNQYNCSRCETACDANKGLIFKKLPYILTIQLKRFEFDWEADRRYKLNDRIIFPMVLDMNPYMDRTSEGFKSSPDIKPELVNPSFRSDVKVSRLSHSRPSIALDHPQSNGEEDSANSHQIGWSHETVTQKLIEVQKTGGPDVYQLFAVLVHRGGLTGGHYFAYILDFESHRWYRCDDSYVRKADIEDIEVSFGGDEEDKEPTSAYMLMYRRYDPEINTMPSLYDEMPHHIQELWTTMVAKEKEAHDAEELEKNTIRISVHSRVKGSWNVVDGEMNIPKGASTAEATLLVYQKFFPNEPEPSSDQVRLCRYDKDLSIIENSFEGNDEQYITYTLRNPLPQTKNEGLIIECRAQNEQFYSYTPDDYVFIGQLIDDNNEDINWVEEIHAGPLETIAGLRTILSAKFKIPIENLFAAVHVAHQMVKHLTEDSAPLSSLGLRKINYVNEIFVKQTTPEEINNLLAFVDNYVHSILFELEVQTPQLEASAIAEVVVDDKSAGEDTMSKTIETANEGVNEESNGKVTSDPAAETPCNGHTEETIQKIPEPSGVIKENQNGETPENEQSVKEEAGTEKELLVTTATSPSAEGSEQDSQVKGLTKSSPNYILNIKNEKRSGQWLLCNARVDGRMPLSLFSNHISRLISVPEEKFILYKVEKGEEAEILYLSGTFNSWTPMEKLRIKMGHRLQRNEGRVTVYLLRRGVPFENCPIIGEVPLSLAMSAEEARQAVLTCCKQELEGMDTTNCRLRKRNQTAPSKVFRPNTKVADFFSYSSIHGAGIYLQILMKPEAIAEKCYPILIRRWRPSTVTLESPVEIVIFYDHSENIETVILKQLIEITQIPETDIEVAKPDSCYPYNMNPLAVEELVWFPLSEPSKKSLYVYNDELTLFVRDKQEEMKVLSPEEETEYKTDLVKNQGTYYGTTPYALNTPPRKEAGLKINLARSPPSS